MKYNKRNNNYVVTILYSLLLMSVKLFFQVSKEFFEQIYSQDIESTNEPLNIEISYQENVDYKIGNKKIKDDKIGDEEKGDEEKGYNEIEYNKYRLEEEKNIYFYTLISILKNLFIYIQCKTRLKNE